MGSIQFLGLASGTDWNSIIDQLVQVERAPLEKLIAQRTRLQQSQSLTRRASERLATLNQAYSNLRFESTFLSRLVAASDPARVNARAEVGAQTGTYNIEVSRLAQPSRATSGLGDMLFSKVANLGQTQTMGIASVQPIGGTFQPTRALAGTLIKDTLQAGKQGAAITAGDTISITGTLKGGGAVNASFTFAGDGTDTLQRLATTISQAFQGEIGASVGSNGELVFLETNPAAAGDVVFNPALNLALNDADFSGSTLTFAIGNNVPGAGATARRLVHGVTFTTAGLPETNAAADLALLDQVTAGTLDVGDVIRITGLENNGTPLAPVDFTYTGAAGGQTIQDLLNTISGAFAGADASYNNGRIELTDIANGTSVTSINLAFIDNGGATSFALGGFFVAEPGRAQQAQMVTTSGFTVEGTGEHLLSSTNGRGGRITGSIPISDPSNALSTFLGVTDFASFTIDVDGPGGTIGPRTVGGLNQYSTVQDLVDAINAQVPAVTAQLRQSGSNYVFEVVANQGGRDIRVYDSAAGIMQGIMLLGSTDLDSSANDAVNTFGSTTATTDVTIVDWFQPTNGGPRQRRAYSGSDGSGITSLIGGVQISGGGGLTPGVATVVTANSSELNTLQAMRSYVFGSSNVALTPPGQLPFLRPDVPLAQAGFATAPQNAAVSPLFHTDGTFTINGVQISVGDVNTTTLNQVLGAINASGAGVTAFFDPASSRVYLRGNKSGSEPIQLGGPGDNSNFLRLTGLLADFGGVAVAGRAAGQIDLDLPAAQAGFTTPVTSGIFTINGVQIAIDSGVDSAQDILDKINRSGAGVTASYDPVSDRLTLAQTLGAEMTATQIQVGDPADTSSFLEAANFTVDTTSPSLIGTQRLTAEFMVNGVAFSRNSNQVDDIVEKLIFELNGVTTGPATINVQADTERMEEAILDFVVEWNTTMELLNAKSLSREERRQLEPLTDESAANMSIDEIDAYNANRQALLARQFYASDSTTRNLVSRLQNLVMGIVSNDGAFQALSDIGLATSEIGGGVAAAQVSQGRLLGLTSDREVLRQLLQTNGTLQSAIRESGDDLHKLFAGALKSEFTHPSTVNLGSGLSLASPLRFSLSDGVRTATINFNAGVTGQGSVLNTINSQLLTSGLSGSMFAFFNSQNQLQLRVSSTTAQARVQIQDLSTGSATLLSSLGWQSGLFLGADINESGGVAQRSKRYIDSITGVGGIVLERIKQNGSFDRQIEVFSNAISRAQENLTEYERRLRNKFARLETQLAQMQSQGAALTSALQQASAQTGNGSSSN